MINNNNEFYQNSMINARKDNDEWKNAAGTCSANLIEKSITENGDYSAKADGADGYSSVMVNVPSGGGETFVVGLVDEETLEVSKTLTESLAAYNSNKRVELGIELGPDETAYAVAILWDSNNLAFILRSGQNNISVLPYVDETHVELMPYSENT